MFDQIECFLIESRKGRSVLLSRSNNFRPGRSRFIVTLALWLLLQHIVRVRAADNHADYRFENYREDNGRIAVETHSVLFGIRPIEALQVRGELVYDGISGATPTGRPPLKGSSQVPVAPMTDIRRAGTLGLDWTWHGQTFSPEISHSEENDYESLGLAFNEAIDFNQKNTTIRFGLSHDFDRIETRGLASPKHKGSTDGIFGVSQLLSPTLILTADATYGSSWGYLNDPYKSFRFDGWTDFFPLILSPEKRPSHRTREVLLVTLTHYIDKVNASIEGSYRFHHDTFGVFSHTAAITWHQKLGKVFIMEPGFRYYKQTAADFYHVRLPGFDTDPGTPKFYSADYRLSELQSLTFGLQACFQISEHFYFDAGYQRYIMEGLDKVTAGSAYPKANIFTVGARIWF